jgi:hypothetical protein
MKKSDFYWLPFLMVTLFLGVILTSSRKNTSDLKQEKPNILVILTDDMGYSDIG